MIPINYWAVLVSTILGMAIGYAWYGPLFGRHWRALMGLSEEEAYALMGGFNMRHAIAGLGLLALTYVFAHAIIFMGSFLRQSGVLVGIESALWYWLGFVVPVTIGLVIWYGKPWRLWLIETGYFLVVMIVSGIVLSLWA